MQSKLSANSANSRLPMRNDRELRSALKNPDYETHTLSIRHLSFVIRNSSLYLYMKRLTLLLFSLIFLSSCGKKEDNASLIIGSWKVDSVKIYRNHFSVIHKGSRMIFGSGEYRVLVYDTSKVPVIFKYRIVQDTLDLYEVNGKMKIELLNETRLVLNTATPDHSGVNTFYMSREKEFE